MKIRYYEVTEDETDRADYCETDHSRSALSSDESRREKPSDECDDQARDWVRLYMGEDFLSGFCTGFTSLVALSVVGRLVGSSALMIAEIRATPRLPTFWVSGTFSSLDSSYSING